MDHSPRLSIVAASRNDDHGGHLLRRMQIFVDALTQQCDRFQLDAELIIVEWNPPSDRPRLVEALTWPSGRSCRVRVIEVPPEIHQTLRHAERLPLFQMIAKNVGIRRASASFVLATNIDLLLSDQLCEFLASGKLEEDAMYRIDRYDADPGVPLGVSVEEQLLYCSRNLIRVHEQAGTYPVEHGAIVRPAPVMRRIGAWARGAFSLRTLSMVKHLVPPPIRKQFPPPPPHLHTNACGDFTLLSRARWASLRGYAEFPMYSFHIDSLLCHAAHHDGCHQVVLTEPMRLYHIEHGGGWSPEAQRDGSLDQRLRTLGVPKMSDDDLDAYVATMARNQAPTIFNGEDWGLADQALNETSL